MIVNGWMIRVSQNKVEFRPQNQANDSIRGRFDRSADCGDSKENVWVYRFWITLALMVVRWALERDWNLSSWPGTWANFKMDVFGIRKVLANIR